MSEEHITLKYRIDLEGSVIRDDEVIPLVKQIIEEAKKKYPEKAKALENIEIIDTNIRIKHIQLSVNGGSVCIGMIIGTILAPIIVETWKGIVIPLVQKKLKIEEYKDE